MTLRTRGKKEISDQLDFAIMKTSSSSKDKTSRMKGDLGNERKEFENVYKMRR